MRIDELISFGAKRTPKKTTIKKKSPKQDDSLGQKVQDRLKQYRKTAKMTEGDMVVTAGAVRGTIIDMIADKIKASEDFEQLSQWLKMIVGKELKPRGKHRYTITAADVKEAMNRLKAD